MDFQPDRVMGPPTTRIDASKWIANGRLLLSYRIDRRAMLTVVPAPGCCGRSIDERARLKVLDG
jgi:hypothetical protein